LRLDFEKDTSVTVKGKIVNTVVRDCLYLNWAFPQASLPDPPEPLRYEVHSVDRESYVFVSALLFRHESLHLESFPALKISYPQFHLRLHVLDHDDLPAVWLRHVLVPNWVLPGVRWFGQQPARGGRFRFPSPSSELDRDEWRWEVSRGRALVVAARQSSPRVGSGPSLGSWQQVVDCLRMRARAYVNTATGVRAINTNQRSVALWPVRVSFEEIGLLRSSEALVGAAEWPNLHSSWICPEIPFSFELGRETVAAKMGRPTVPVAPDPAMFRSPSSGARRPAA
jgi:hypothetical protein